MRAAAQLADEVGLIVLGDGRPFGGLEEALERSQSPNLEARAEALVREHLGDFSLHQRDDQRLPLIGNRQGMVVDAAVETRTSCFRGS